MQTGHLVFGVGLVVVGYAVLVVALAEQAQRAAALASMAHAAAEPKATVQAAAPTQPAPSTAPSAPIAAASAQGLPAPAASAGFPSDLPGDTVDARLFKFIPGGAAMSRDEVQRLLALGRILARRPGAKISIEGFGDRSGTEPLMVTIGKHRTKVAQTLLAKAGVAEDRVTSAFVDMGSDVRLAQAVRITTSPPISEIDRP